MHTSDYQHQSQRNPVEELAEEFADRLRRGERPTVDEYVERFPQLAEEIRELFPALLMMEQLGDDAPPEGPPRGPTPGSVPASRLGEFRILREVSRGGMGVVYEAEQASLGRRVALKVLPKGMLLDPKQKKRFRREAKAAAKLHHTNIVPVFGVGEQDGMHYYAMQFISGQSLDEVLAELKRLAQPEAGDQESEVRDQRSEVSENMKPPPAVAPADPQPARAPSPHPPDAVSGVSVIAPNADPSAVELARSLHSGRFQRTLIAEDDSEPLLSREPEASAPAESVPDTSSVRDTGGDPPDTATAKLSETITLSGSATLPGQSETDQTSGTKATYWQSVAKIGIQAAEALQHAHEHGILHRDVKPGNLLLDTAGTVWVADFGLAKADDEQNLTGTGDVIGTLRYMAPEVFEGTTDERSDVCSLGLTLYELIALRPAFDQTDRHRLVRQVMTEAPPRLRAVNREVPRDLELIVHKAIDRDPATRYQTAGELAADLQRFLNDEPIRARRTSPIVRLTRWCRRNPGIAWSSSLAVLMLVAMVVTLAISTVRIAQKESKARANAQQAHEQREIAEAETVRAKQQELAAKRHLHTARVHLAEQEMQKGRWGSALELLEADRPRDGEQDLRGFAWRHLWWRIQSKLLARLRGHENWVNSLAYSLDGKLLASGGSDGTVKLWNPTTAKAVRTLQRDAGRIRSVAISPDGDLLASAGDDRDIVLWDVANGKERHRFQHPHPVRAVVFSPKGGLLASQDLWGAIRLWSLKTGELEAAFAEHEKRTYEERKFLQFSPDGQTLAAQGRAGSVDLWDLASEHKRYKLKRHLGFEAVAFSSDGKILVTAGGNRQIILWDVETGKLVTEWIAKAGYPRSIAFSPDGASLGVGFGEGTVMLLDLESGQKQHYAHAGEVQSVVFSPDGAVLASAGADGAIKLWRTGWTPETSPAAPGHKLVWAVAFSPDGKTLAAGEAGHGVRLRDAATGEVLTEFGGGSIGLDFSPNGRKLACAGPGSAFRVWELREEEDPQLVHEHSSRKPSHTYAVAFSPDGQILAVGRKSGTINLWNTATWQRVESIQAGDNWVWSLDFSPDGKWLASGGLFGSEYSVALWDWRKRKLHAVVEKACGPAIFSPDGTILACQAHQDLGRIKLWNVKTQASRKIGEELTTIYAQHHRLAFFPDGKTLAHVGGGEVRLWDVATGEERPMLKELPHWAFSLAVSPDGKTLATGGSNGTVRLWRTFGRRDRSRDVNSDREETARRSASGGVSPVAAAAVRLTRQKLESLDVEPGAAEWHAAGAATYARLGEYDRSADEFTKAIDLLSSQQADRGSRREIYRQLVKWDPVFERIAELRPEDGKLWLARGRYLLRNADDWRGAAQAFVQAVERGAIPAYLSTLNDWPPSGYRWWFLRGMAAVAATRTEDYRRICRQLLEECAGTDDPHAAALLVWCCKLRPRAVEDLEAVIRLGEKALKRLPGKRRLMHDFGCVLYRAGRYEQALERLEEASERRAGGSTVWDWIWLAMAHHHLGHADQAEHWIEKVDQWMEHHLAKQSWQVRLELEFLRTDAAALMEGDGRRSAQKGDLSQSSEPAAAVAAPKPNHD